MGLFAFNPQSSLLHRPPLSTPSGLAAHCGVAARPRLRLIPTVAHAGMPQAFLCPPLPTMPLDPRIYGPPETQSGGETPRSALTVGLCGVKWSA